MLGSAYLSQQNLSPLLSYVADWMRFAGGYLSVTSYDVGIIRVFHAIACKTVRMLCGFIQTCDLQRELCNSLHQSGTRQVENYRLLQAAGLSVREI